MIRRLAPVALVLALSACGFHLRNALVLPPDLGPVKVDSASRYSPLAERLRQSLDRAGAEIATADHENTAVLDVIAERWGDTPISVDARGRAQEYSLRYATIFELRGRDGQSLVPRQSIELSRDYVREPTSDIGTEAERDILVKELRREMAASILRRIDAVARRGGLEAGSTTTPSVEDTADQALPAAPAEPEPPEIIDDQG